MARYNFDLDKEVPNTEFPIIEDHLKQIANTINNIAHYLIGGKILKIFGPVLITTDFYDKIKDCDTIYIDFMSFNLRWIPEHITKVFINYLDRLETRSLIDFKGSISDLHDRVKILMIYNFSGPITKLPTDLEYFELDNEFKNEPPTLPDVLPPNLRTLCFAPMKDSVRNNERKYFNHQLPILPANLKYLELAKGYNHPINFIDTNLEIFIMKDYNVGAYNGDFLLPEGLKYLILDLPYLTKLNPIPNSIKKIILHGQSLPYDINFTKPTELEVLEISNIEFECARIILKKYREEIDNGEFEIIFIDNGEEFYSSKEYTVQELLDINYPSYPYNDSDEEEEESEDESEESEDEDEEDLKKNNNLLNDFEKEEKASFGKRKFDGTDENTVYGYNKLSNSWHCTKCGDDMGSNNPRQLCGKFYCITMDSLSNL